MTNPHVSVQIVAWNGMTHLPSCLDAIRRQTYQPLTIMMVDNGSVDGTVAWVSSTYPQVHLLRNTRNLGFCHGHNQAIRITDAPFILCLNQDVVLTPTWIEQAIRVMTDQPDVAAVGGKLLRYTYSAEELKNIVPSGTIDSAGLQLFRSRHTLDRGSGQADTGQFNGAEAVVGINGACLLVRRTALETVRWRDEYFDEDFFAYKDDVDLARRFLRQGWRNWYDGQIVAYHHRSIQGQDSPTSLSIARNYRRRQQWNTTLSYRNHWLLLMKHETWSSLWPDLPWVAWYELRKAGWLLLTRPATLAGLTKAIQLRTVMRAKARLMNRTARQPAETIHQWFRPSP